MAFELNKDQFTQAKERMATREVERLMEVERVEAERAREKSLATSNESGFMQGDIDAKIAARVDKDKKTIADINKEIEAGLH